MATGQAEADRRKHPVVWILVGVISTLAALAVGSFIPQLAGRPQLLAYHRGGAAKADVKPPFPPVPLDPPQSVVIPLQLALSGQSDTSTALVLAKEAPKDIPEWTFANPGEVVKVYLRAKRWEDRLPCVMNPKLVRQLMAARYGHSDLSTGENAYLPGNLTVKDGAGGNVFVDVDVRESHPYFQ